mgnify:CR=1 FL=1
MLILRRLLATVIAVVTIAIFIPLIFLSTLTQHFTDPAFFNKHLLKANVYEHLSHEIVPALASEVEIPQEDISSELSLEVLKVLDPEWFQKNIELSLAELIPYLSGNQEHFNIEISVKDRAEAALAFLNNKFKEPKYYVLFTDNILLPILYEKTNEVIDNNIGLQLTEIELNELVVSSITQKEYETLLDEAFYTITPYILGEKDSFSITIHMDDKWDQSLNNLVTLADRKLTNIFYESPKCCCEELALEQLKDIDTSNAKFLFDGSIFCFPPDLEYEDAKSLMSISLEKVLTDSLIEQMPPYITLTSKDIGENQDEFLALARSYSTIKITLNDKRLLENAFRNDRDSIQQFNSLRSLISSTPKPLEIISIFSVAVLIISLIGGRLWLGLIQWAATITAIFTGLIIFIIIGIRMASHQIETVITNSLTELLTESTDSVTIIITIFNNVLEELTTSIQNQFQIYFMVSIIIAIMTLIYSSMYKRRGS